MNRAGFQEQVRVTVRQGKPADATTFALTVCLFFSLAQALLLRKNMPLRGQ